jgi:hypothetical protein
MTIFFIASLITTAVLCVWATAVVGVAVKSQLSQRQRRQLQYWQARAMQAENPKWRQP